MKTLSLEPAQSPDGCGYTDSAVVVAYAAHVSESSPKKREGFPRFTVKIDGETANLQTPKALEKFLYAVSPCPCRIFRNAGFGATLDFDNL